MQNRGWCRRGRQGCRPPGPRRAARRPWLPWRRRTGPSRPPFRSEYRDLERSRAEGVGALVAEVPLFDGIGAGRQRGLDGAVVDGDLVGDIRDGVRDLLVATGVDADAG